MDKKYTEFRGHTNHRIAIGAYCSFMVMELTEKFSIDAGQSGGGQEKQTHGCLVYLPGLPSFIVKDFYPTVIDKMVSLGTSQDKVAGPLKEFLKNSS